MNVYKKALIVSILTTLFVSAIVGGLISLFLGFVDGIVGFVLCTALQIWAAGVYKDYKTRRDLADVSLLLEDAAEIKVPIELRCAYCNMINRVPISLIIDNSFKCVSCNQPNKIYIQFTTTRITQPLAPPVETGEVKIDEEPTIGQTAISDKIEITSGT